MDVFLAQLFGIYFLVVGVLVLTRRTSIMPAMRDLAANRGVILLLSVAQLAAGLAVVLVYPEVSLTPNGIISLVGWMLLVEAVFYLAMPHRTVQKFMGGFNKEKFFIWGGVLSMALGVYLAGTGFGFFV